MASSLSLAFFAAAAIVAVTEARAIPAEPVSLMMDSHGNPVLFLREKRTPVNPYPHRAMMLTGYYRPVRRANGGQATTGVFAQGNAVSGGTYLGNSQPNYLQRGPEPSEEADVSSAEAEAAPNPLEHHVDEEEQNNPAHEDQHHDQQDSQAAQEEDQEPSAYTTEAPAAEEPAVQNTQSPRRPSKKQGAKKSKKTPIQFESEDDDEDESEDNEDDDDDQPAVPFIPFKSNRRQGNVPNLNNFFPMVFSFPQGSARRGASSSSSPPGMITAIANSYSTSKGGVASSVATAYGGSPQSKKQRRAQPAQE